MSAHDHSNTPVPDSHERPGLLERLPENHAFHHLENDDLERSDSHSSGRLSTEGVAHSGILTQASEQSKPPQKYAKKRRCIHGWMWSAEVASLVVAALSFMAIALILSFHQDQPRPQWPYHITVNALISVFTTIFKAALLVPVTEGKYHCD